MTAPPSSGKSSRQATAERHGRAKSPSMGSGRRLEGQSSPKLVAESKEGQPRKSRKSRRDSNKDVDPIFGQLNQFTDMSFESPKTPPQEKRKSSSPKKKKKNRRKSARGPLSPDIDKRRLDRENQNDDSSDDYWSSSEESSSESSESSTDEEERKKK